MVPQAPGGIPGPPVVTPPVPPPPVKDTTYVTGALVDVLETTNQVKSLVILQYLTQFVSAQHKAFISGADFKADLTLFLVQILGDTAP